MSDGYHSLHMIAVSDLEAGVNENDRNEKEEKLVQISGFHSPIFWKEFNIFNKLILMSLCK